MIYLNANGRLDDALSEVTVLGGKIVQSKHAIGPFGIVRLSWILKGTGWCTLRLVTNAAPRMRYEHPLCKLPTRVSVLSISCVCYAVLMPAFKPVATRVSCS